MSAVIFGIPINNLSVDELHDEIASFIRKGKKTQILHANIHGLNLAYEEPWFSNQLKNADIVFCDGAGVRLGARILGNYIPPRITYADWMWQLGQFVEQEKFTLFFLGAKPEIASKAAEKMKARFSKLQIIGVEHGYFDKMPNSVENQAVIEKINDVKPNILIVGFGMPLQEKWLMENIDYLDVNVALTGGAVFDYLSGELSRAPKWMTENGMEWLGRLFIEPRRLWKRYLIGNPLFFLRIFQQKLKLGKFHKIS